MNGPQYQDIRVEVDQQVAIVTLNRPAAHNSWSWSMSNELIDAYQNLEKDPNVRVIILTADPASKIFCAGADLTLGDFSSDDGRSGFVQSVPEIEARDGGGKFVLTVLNSRKVTIAAINGSAAGIGITQTLPMDLRFVWADAKIVFPFVRRGIVTEALSSYLLPRLIGRSKAMALFLQATSDLSASSPLLSGLFAELIPKKEDVLPHAVKIGHELAKNVSPTSVAITKSLVLEGADSPEAHHLLDSRALYIAGNGHDGKEGVRSYLEKRAPIFQNYDTARLPTWLKRSARL